MEKIGHRHVIQYFHLKGLSQTNIKAELDSTQGESAPSFTTVKYWVAEINEVVRAAKTSGGRLSSSSVVDQMRRRLQKW
ncbi:hypothetical protein TNCV_4310031 [Trichonephila clavipes]|nr:hypothetical protein TNCV_4310031 [Trichonephila clavipes]